MITMYNSISGTLTGRLIETAGQQACVETGGIEWILEISKSSFVDLPAEGSQVRLYVYCHTREDQAYLCGFLKLEERHLFLDLLKVEGIGPKQALKILSGAQVDRLLVLLEEGNVEGLEQLPGLGKKTAQKMVLTLKGKLKLDDESPAAKQRSATIDIAKDYEELAQALVQMGYDRKLAVVALNKLIPEFKDFPKAHQEQELLRRAIIDLS